MTPAEQYLENFTRALLVDALLQAWPQYWERRARAFENARPTVGEHHGDRTVDELRAKWLELTEIAAACRARGTLAPVELFEADVDAVLREVA